MNFLIGMTDGVSAPAKAAANSLSTLDAQIKAENASLRALESQFRALNKAQTVDLETARKLQSAIAGKRESVAGLTQQMVAQGGAGFQAAKGTEALTKESDSLLTKVSKLSMVYTALSTAVRDVAAAFRFMGSAISDMAAASEEKGDVTRSLELLYGGQEAAENTYRAIEGITSRVAISQERALALSDSLIKAGEVNGDRMIKSIEAIGKAEAARKGAGQVLEGVITRSMSSRMFSISRSELRQVGLSYREMSQEIAKQTGKGVAETEIMLRTGGVRLKEGLNALTNVVDSKMGELAQRKFLTIGNQTQRLRDNFKRLFETFDTGPMAKGLKVIADLFDETNVNGSALRAVLKGAFEEVGKVIEWLSPYVSLFFDGMTLMALRVWNALYPLRKALKDTFGKGNGTEDFQNTMLTLADDVGAFVGKAAEFFAGLVRNWDAIWQTFDEVMADPLGAVLSGFGDMFSALGQMISDANQAMWQSFADMGKEIIAGLINGITSGVGAVGDAFTNLASSGLSKFKSVLGIASPSKVMAQQGEFVNEGLAQGVERSAGKPAAAMAGAASALPGAAAGGARGGSGGGGVQVVFQAGAIVLQAAGLTGAQESELRARLADLMADVFQQAALTQGAGAAA